MKNIDLLLKCLMEELEDTASMKDTLDGLHLMNNEILESLNSLKVKEADVVRLGFTDDANTVVNENISHSSNIQNGVAMYAQLMDKLKAIAEHTKLFKKEKESMRSSLVMVKSQMAKTRSKCLSLQDKVTPVVGRGSNKKKGK